MQKFIYLLPFGQIDTKILDFLSRIIFEKFDFPCRILKSIEIPKESFSQKRNQYHGNLFLNKMKDCTQQEAEKILGITDVDLYASNLNFIFGQAEIDGKLALISLARLNPEFWHQEFNQELFQNRAEKEAIHELGHTFGLSHCQNPKCIMHFSNTLAETDYKNTDFCENCKSKF